MRTATILSLLVILLPLSARAADNQLSEIRCEGPHIHVKVNGQQVCAMNSDDYDQPGLCPDGAHHKFKLNGKSRAVKDFARLGYLGFQDHGQKVWYKNVKLLELLDETVPAQSEERE